LAASHLIALVALMRDYASRGYADFSIGYVAGHILAFGDRHRLYDIDYQASVHRQLLPATSGTGLPLLYNHAPHEALLYVPLAHLPFAAAYYVWIAACVVALAIAVALLSRITGMRPRFVALITVAFFPIIVAFAQGQISVMVLLLYAIAARAMTRGRAALAGLSLAVALFKPQLVLPFIVLLALRRHFRVLTWFCLGAAGVVAVSLALVGISGARDYVQLARFLEAHPAQAFIFPENMENVRGVVVGLGKYVGAAGATMKIATIVLSLMTLAVVWLRGGRQAGNAGYGFGSTDLLWLGAAITATALTSYHMYLHDASLMLIPVCIFIVALRKHPSWRPRDGIVALALLFLTPLHMLGLREQSAYVFAVPIAVIGWRLLEASRAPLEAQTATTHTTTDNATA
jgi:hypothetical protein